MATKPALGMNLAEGQGMLQFMLSGPPAVSILFQHPFPFPLYEEADYKTRVNRVHVRTQPYRIMPS